MSVEDPENPQLFVDEDWKSRVEAEKKAAAVKSATESLPAAAAETAADPPQVAEPRPSASDTPREAALPPATLSFLVTTLATQAMVSLGQVPNPFSGNIEIRLPEARHFIDTLTMLEAKTAGNRAAEESALLDSCLHQLRMAYIEATSAPKTA